MMKAGVELAGEVGDQMKKGWDLMKKKGLPMLSRFAQSTKSKVVSMTKEVSDQVQSKMKKGESEKKKSDGKKKGDEKKKLRRANKVEESESESDSESDEKPAKKSESEDSESSENENEVAYL